MSVAGSSGPSGQTNRTIDDEQGDSVTGVMPVYNGHWNYGPACPGCLVQPDPSRAFDNSWHDTTIDPPATDFPSVTLTFTGTAIYAFGIVPNTLPYTTTLTNVTFAFDGQPAGTFFHTPDASDSYLYGVNIFSKVGLTNSQHTLKIVPQAGANGSYLTNGSYLAFDYAIYTFEDIAATTSASASETSDSSSTSSSSSPSSISPGPDLSSRLPAPGLSSTSPASGHSSTSPAPGHSSTSPAPGHSSTSPAPGHSSISPAPGGSNRPRSVPVGAIVGSAVAMVVFAVLALLFVLRRRRRASANHTLSNGEMSDGIDEGAIKTEPLQPSASNTTEDLPGMAVSEPLLSVMSEQRPMNECSAGHSYGNSAHGIQPSMAVSVVASASAFALSSDRAFGPSIDGDVTHSDGSPRPGTFGATARSPAISAIGRNAVPPGTKAELSRRLQQMEQYVADLNARRTGSSVAPSSSVGARGRSGGNLNGTNEGALRTQVEALQAEVERLRATQQQQAMWEVGSEPPPAYEGRREAEPAPNPRRRVKEG